MEETHGLPLNGPLPFARTAVDMLASLCPSLHLQPSPLTVGNFLNRRLQVRETTPSPPFLGYLSECSTGANQAARLADEGIHLVNVLAASGVPARVGTLWEVSDRHCVHVARGLYVQHEMIWDEGMTDRAVYRGTHDAVRTLRDTQLMLL